MKKVCTKCLLEKDESEFGAKRSGRNTRCKSCNSESGKAWYRANKPVALQKARQKYLTRTAEILKQTAVYAAANPAKRLLYQTRHRAKKLGIPCTITEADLIFPETCPVLGIPLFKGTGPMQPNSPSIDKYAPELGYVPGNVYIISNRANILKRDATAEEIRAVLKYLEKRPSVDG